MMAEDGARVSIPIILSNARPHAQDARQRQRPAKQVDDRGTRVIDSTVTQAQVMTELGEPSAPPHPAAVEWEDDCAVDES